jgi:antirestriction protein
LDLRDLAEVARDCGAEIEDVDTDEEDRVEAQATLVALSNLAAELGHQSDETDAGSVADALDDASDSFSSGLIAEDYFEDYAKQLVEDLGMIPEGISDVISSNIDWEGVASDLLTDYTSVTLDGEDYYIR